MKYKRFVKEVDVRFDGIIEFEIPETVAHIRILESNNKESVIITGLECYGEAKIPNKKYKLICLCDDNFVEHTVGYEPKTMFFGDVKIRSKVKGDKVYSCFGLS